MSNEFSRLPPKPGQMQINQKQGSLALEIDKQTEIWRYQLNRLIVLWLTLYARAMSVSTSPASRRAIASLR